MCLEGGVWNLKGHQCWLSWSCAVSTQKVLPSSSAVVMCPNAYNYSSDYESWILDATTLPMVVNFSRLWKDCPTCETSIDLKYHNRSEWEMILFLLHCGEWPLGSHWLKGWEMASYSVLITTGLSRPNLWLNSVVKSHTWNVINTHGLVLCNGNNKKCFDSSNKLWARWHRVEAELKLTASTYWDHTGVRVHVTNTEVKITTHHVAGRSTVMHQNS